MRVPRVLSSVEASFVQGYKEERGDDGNGEVHVNRTETFIDPALRPIDTRLTTQDTYGDPYLLLTIF